MLRFAESPILPAAKVRRMALMEKRRHWPNLSAWWGAYTGGGTRDLRIDFLRGFAVLAMVADHVAGRSALHLVTGGNRFYTSAAEGFIFISGLVVGQVYLRYIQRDGMERTIHKAWHRARTLYLLAVGLTIVFLPLSEMLAMPWAQGVDVSDPIGLMVSIWTIHRTYYLVDIPILYALLMFMAPLALLLMHEGNTKLLLLASWGIWLLYQFFPAQATLPWTIDGNYLFRFSAWQVYFFTGMVIGYHRASAAKWLSRFNRRLLLALSGAGFALLIALYANTTQFLNAIPGLRAANFDELALLEYVFAKGDARPGRIVSSVVVFGFLFLLVTELWQPLRRLLGWLLMPLGENALYAYSAHIVVVAAVGMLTVYAGLSTASGAANLVLQIAGIFLIWGMIQRGILLAWAENWKVHVALPAGSLGAIVLLLQLDASPAYPGWVPPPTVETSASRAERQALAFGTPVPRLAEVPAQVQRQALPTPRPAPAASQVASPFVGKLVGTFRESTFYSPSLDREMPYLVYLPPDYDVAGRRYPVLYMLHGLSGDRQEWTAYGLIDAADRMIAAREINPLIIVLPQGDFGFWVNDVDGPAWGDYLRRDVRRHVDATYRTLMDARHRAVGGLSMGAFGAAALAFNHPDQFGIVGLHSPSLRQEGEIDLLGTGAQFATIDPLTLARTAPNLDRLDIMVDSGENDGWLPQARELHEELLARGIDHIYQEPPGGHEGGYWVGMSVTYLQFYDRAFSRNP